MDILALKLKKEVLPCFSDGSGPTSIAFAACSFVSNSTKTNSLWITSRLIMQYTYINNITTFPKYVVCLFFEEDLLIKKASLGLPWWHSG